MSRLIRRTVTTLVLSASADGLIRAEAAHAAEMYKVNTSGIALTVRSGPGTNYSSVGSVPDGGSVEIRLPDDRYLCHRHLRPQQHLGPDRPRQIRVRQLRPDRTRQPVPTELRHR